MRASDPPAIEVTGLVKAFGRHRALDGLDLTVPPGQIHGFLGPNGAGKSTTIRVLLGMYRRDAGSARVLGLDPARDARMITRRSAYVPGDVALWPGLTGGQALDALAGLRGARDQRREAELIEAFQLDPSKPMRSYSKGNRQKVMLVAALAAPCELLILDEPTSELDPLQSEVFVEAVGQAAGQGRTVLMSSHIMAEVDRLCDAVTIVKDGRAVESGSMSELRHLRSSRITCRLPQGSRVDPAWEPRGGPAHGASDDLPAHQSPSSPAPDADGRFTASVPAERVAGLLTALIDAGAQEITCAPVSLDEVFLEHYQAGAR
ncbi:ABC transporter ATP-binding protein [Actinomyces marmotae]|uniref:ABC transporter ATP-binding protein n=1 Tax=Actinomyces marmotae TaxID=2737173 RepID=UPI00135BA601|nr:ABC transporter ATP-binding protein [Actinomyces marmotae]